MIKDALVTRVVPRELNDLIELATRIDQWTLEQCCEKGTCSLSSQQSQVQINSQPNTLQVFVDSGADTKFSDNVLSHQLGLKLVPLV